MATLLEMLRQVDPRDGNENGTRWYRNPEGPEAADRIEELEAEVEQLKTQRRVLGDIINEYIEKVKAGKAEVERLRADPRLTLTADDLYVVLSWCPVGNETAGRVRRVADALEEA